MDYFVLQVGDVSHAADSFGAGGSAEVVRVWEQGGGRHDYLAVRGDSLDDAVAFGRSCGLDVLSAGRIVIDGVEADAEPPGLDERLPSYLLPGAVDLFENPVFASLPQSIAWCERCETFHRPHQHVK
jgi:hypothetical protein